MENGITTSASSLRSYRLGFLIYFGAILCIYPFMILSYGFESLEDKAKYIVPMAIAIGSIIIMITGFNTSSQNAETTSWNKNMGVAGLLSLSFPLLLHLAFLNDEPDTPVKLILVIVFSIALVIIANCYSKLQAHGTSLTSKGAYWIIGGLAAIIISDLLLESLMETRHNDYYTNYDDYMQSFRHKQATYQMLDHAGKTAIIGGIFALLFGSKIVIAGMEQLETEQEQPSQPTQPAQPTQPSQPTQPKEEQPLVKGNFDDTTHDSGMSL